MPSFGRQLNRLVAVIFFNDTATSEIYTTNQSQGERLRNVNHCGAYSPPPSQCVLGSALYLCPECMYLEPCNYENVQKVAAFNTQQQPGFKIRKKQLKIVQIICQSIPV